MANGNEVKKNGANNRTLAAGIISIMLASVGSPFLLVKLGVNPYRDDPAKGTELRLVEARLAVTEDYLREHVGPAHPDKASNFDARITSNAIDIAVFKSKLDGMDKKLDRLLDKK